MGQNKCYYQNQNLSLLCELNNITAWTASPIYHVTKNTAQIILHPLPQIILQPFPVDSELTK
jgi:hypothetical protein